MGEPRGQHPGLAGAGAGKHQQRALGGGDGFPLRLVIPRLLAYKNAKYVERIELTDKPVEGFWVKLGYSYEGEVPEDRLREGKY